MNALASLDHNSKVLDPTEYIKSNWYRGSSGLKKAGVQTAFTTEMKAEAVRCRDDIEYFCSKYVYITDVDKGVVKFEARPYQKKFWKLIQKNRFIISKQGRQAGKCDSYINKIKVKSPEGHIYEVKIGDFYEWMAFRKMIDEIM